MMEFPKPKCYDTVPVCVCMDCQLYDVKQMVKAKSSIVSSHSPFLPRYAASLLSHPSVESAPCSVSSALSSRPSCSIAESTCGLADVNVPKFLSRPRLDFADLSSPCFVPACDPVPVVSSACSVAAPPVRSSSALPAQSSPVAVPCSSVPAPPSPVTAPPGFVAPPGFRPVFVLPSPVRSACSVPLPVRLFPSGFASCSPVSSVAQPLCSAFIHPHVPSGRPILPLVCLVLAVVPVLLSTPFGFVLSFFPVLR